MDRIIQLRGSRNVRELGGYATKSGKKIAWHKLIRSAKLSNLNQHDIEVVQKYGIKTIIDFRSEGEVNQDPDCQIPNTQYFFNPILNRDETENSKDPDELQTEMTTNPITAVERMKEIYRKMVRSEESQKAYRNFFEILLSKGEGGIIFHCTSGKDRTGLGAIYILNALEVPEKTIQDDYILTNQVTSKYLDRLINELNDQKQSDIFINNVKSLYTVSLTYYFEAKKMMEKLAGSAPNYLLEILKLSSNDIKDLQKLFLQN